MQKRSTSLGIISFILVLSALPLKSQQTQPLSISVTQVQLIGAETLNPAEREEVKRRSAGITAQEGWLSRLKMDLTRLLADQGFLKAEMKLQPVSLRKESSPQVRLKIEVKEGPRFRVAQIWWSGKSVLTLRQLSEALLLKTGDILRPSLVLKSADLVRAACEDSGFKRANVTPQWQLLEEGRSTLYFDVDNCGGDGQVSVTPPETGSTPVACEMTAANRSAAHFPITSYDVRRNAAADLADARVEAAHSGRRIFVVVGGKWCGWCRVLEDVFDTTLSAERDKYFVTVTVNYSEENRNQCALNTLSPNPLGYPFIYVLDEGGRVIHADDTTSLQFAGGYDKSRMLDFLRKWSREVR